MPDFSTLPARLRWDREQAGLTRQELAERLYGWGNDKAIITEYVFPSPPGRPWTTWAFGTWREMRTKTPRPLNVRRWMVQALKQRPQEYVEDGEVNSLLLAALAAIAFDVALPAPDGEDPPLVIPEWVSAEALAVAEEWAEEEERKHRRKEMSLEVEAILKIYLPV